MGWSLDQSSRDAVEGLWLLLETDDARCRTVIDGSVGVPRSGRSSSSLAVFGRLVPALLRLGVVGRDRTRLNVDAFRRERVPLAEDDDPDAMVLRLEDSFKDGIGDTAGEVGSWGGVSFADEMRNWIPFRTTCSSRTFCPFSGSSSNGEHLNERGIISCNGFGILVSTRCRSSE